jgi:hypothetical protein
MLDRFLCVMATCALAGTTFVAAAADEVKSAEKKGTEKKGAEAPGPLPRAPRQDHGSKHHQPPAAEGKNEKKDAAPMTRAPAPASGSMPKGGATPSGKLGTEPTARGRLGTDPTPGEGSKPPPRLN